MVRSGVAAAAILGALLVGVVAMASASEAKASTETVPACCADGKKNGDEEGVDCGGSCGACTTAVAAAAAKPPSGLHRTYPLHRHEPPTPPSHTARRRRRLEAASRRRRLEVDDTSLFGDVDTLGYYYAYLHIGTPPQKQTVIVDTGSSLVAVPCADCNACGRHMDAPYDLSKSSTGRELLCDNGNDDRECMETTRIHSDDWGCNGESKCEFTLSYTEGSRLQGHFVEDVVCINDDPCDLEPELLPKIRFGCADIMGGLFRSQKADGIMGLGWGAEMALEPLRAENSRAHATLQLCLTHGGGFMTVGDGDLDVQQIRKEGETTWTRMQSKGSKPFFRVSTAMFTVHDTKITAAGYSLTTNDPGITTILDSGSTYSYLPDGLWRHMQGAFDTFCHQKGHCLSRKTKKDPTSLHCMADNRHLDTYPDITIYFAPGSGRRLMAKGAPKIQLTPVDYFFPYLGNWCVGFIRDPNLDRVELGANALLDHLVTFDPEKHMVGFTKADCNSKKAVKRRMGEGEARAEAAIAAAAAAAEPAAATRKLKPQAALNLETSGGHVGHVGLAAVYLLAVVAMLAVAAVALARERGSEPQRTLLLDATAPHSEYRSYVAQGAQ